ncbi:TPA: hypothetical protein SLZ59_000521 [Vibrio cholerae]|nr:hypothetical protein [Vibrio cholerae]
MQLKAQVPAFCWFFLCIASAHLNIVVSHRNRTICIMVGWTRALRRAVSLSAVVPNLVQFTTH